MYVVDFFIGKAQAFSFKRQIIRCIRDSGSVMDIKDVCRLITILERKKKKMETEAHTIFLRLLNAELLLDRFESEIKNVEVSNHSSIPLMLADIF